MHNCRRAGIATKGYVMVGLPGETPETIHETERFVLGLDLDLLTVNHFVCYPGTLDWQRADRFGEVDRSWDACSEHRISFVPTGLTREDLLAARRRIVRRFYLRPRILGRAAVMARSASGWEYLARGAAGLWGLLARGPRLTRARRGS